MKITIKTTPDSISLEVSKINAEEFRKIHTPLITAIKKDPDFNTETGSLEKEAESFEELDSIFDEIIDGIEVEMAKAEKA